VSGSLSHKVMAALNCCIIFKFVVVEIFLANFVDMLECCLMWVKGLGGTG
jgi:hypothetical protein